MRKLIFLSCIFLLGFHYVRAIHQDNTVQKDQFRKQDQLGEYLYATLDAFLERPTEAHLHLLENIEDHLWRPLQTPEEQLAYVIVKSNEGYYQMQFNHVDQAISAYEEAWKIYKENGLTGFDIIEYCLKPLGNAYSMLGDFESAENIVKSYLLEAKKHSDPEHIASALINLSIIYYSTGRFDHAISILEDGLKAKELPENKKSLFYANLAKNHLALAHNEKALRASETALQYLNQNPVWNFSDQLVGIYSTLSILYGKSGEISLALQNIQEANAIADTSQVIKPRTRAKLKIQQAGILNEINRDKEALQLYKQTLRQLIPGYEDVSKFPDRTLLYAENTLKEALDGMASIYAKMDSFELALQCYDLSFEVEDQLRSGYNYREATYLQQRENRDRAEKAILLLLRMHAKDKNDQHVKRAFIVAENTKSLVLKSAHYDQLLWEDVGNDSLAQVRKSLNQQKAQLQNAMTQEKLKGENADLHRIETLINQQNQVMIDLKAIKGKIFSQQDLPFEREIQTDSLQQILLARGETLIQYFWGNDYLFAFKLDGKNIELRSIENVDSLKKNLRTFISFFEGPDKINNDYSAYAQLAHNLYAQLLPERIDNSLILIPDGLLNFIPFEALVSEMPENAQYSQWSWVLNKYPITYRSSAVEILGMEKEKKQLVSEVLGVFPEFAGKKEYLKYSKEEYEEIHNLFDGKYLLQDQATKEAFLKNVDQYPILHLSTHANAGNLFQPPSIAFIDSSLFLPEIHGLDIDNQLMVLSACETGLGKLHTGESAISLANGFVQAGVDNIVFSLWRVNDFSTSRLMADFYNHFDEGESITNALRNAKLDYLKREDVSVYNKSPYYWAAFIYYGDTQVKSKGESHFLLIILISGLVVIAVSYYLLRMRR